MKCVVLLLAAVLVSVQGRRINDDQLEVEILPVEGRGSGGRGSSCVIRGRSIEFDGEEDEKSQSKQASIGPGGSIFLPQAAADDPESASSDDSSDDSGSSGSGSSGSSESGSDSGFGPYFGPPPPYYGPPPPMYYGGGYRPSSMDSSSPGETSLSLSSEPNFGGGYYPMFYKGDKKEEKYKYKKKSKKDKKKGGNINCIIITKTKTKTRRKKEPLKIFGIPLPITRRRRSIAHQMKALKSQ